MPKTLHFFPDTNLFIQCRGLTDLPWEDCGDFEEIHLIVSRPIQIEIDRQKTNGHGRPQKRARKIAGLLRDSIVNKGGIQIPYPKRKVTIALDLKLRPEESAKTQLDFTRNDDLLVGIALQFARLNPQEEVRILSDDVGVFASAEAAGVPYFPIPEEWLLAPEASANDKEMKALRDENSDLKKPGPAVDLWCSLDGAQKTDRIDAEVARYQPLTDTEIRQLMDRLEARCPIAVDFGRKEPLSRGSGFSIQRFEAASESEIENYVDALYPEWLKACEEFFRNLHVKRTQAERLPKASFVGQNSGSSPAKDVLVEISASGNFLILPDDEDRPNPRVALSDIVLPSAPKAPRGKWTSFMSGLPVVNFAAQTTRGNWLGAAPLLAHRIPMTNDPNRFYWKPPHSVIRQDLSSICEQWRHGSGPEPFTLELHAESPDGRPVKGILKCVIHAENLPAPVRTQVPVLIKFRDEQILAYAQDMVDNL